MLAYQRWLLWGMIITAIIIIIISTAPQNHCHFFLLLISSPNRIQLTTFPLLLSFPLNQKETTEAKYAKYRRLSKVSYDWSPPTIANTIFQDTALTNFLGNLKSEQLSCLNMFGIRAMHNIAQPRDILQKFPKVDISCHMGRHKFSKVAKSYKRLPKVLKDCQKLSCMSCPKLP